MCSAGAASSSIAQGAQSGALGAQPAVSEVFLSSSLRSSRSSRSSLRSSRSSKSSLRSSRSSRNLPPHNQCYVCEESKDLFHSSNVWEAAMCCPSPSFTAAKIPRVFQVLQQLMLLPPEVGLLQIQPECLFGVALQPPFQPVIYGHSSHPAQGAEASDFPLQCSGHHKVQGTSVYRQYTNAVGAATPSVLPPPFQWCCGLKY